MLSVKERAGRYKYGEKLGGWELDGFLGEGSGGKTAVFRVCKALGQYRDTRAMKVVEVIAREEEWSDYIAEDRERYETQTTKRINRFLKEVEIMGQLEGDPNILSYDHNIVPVRWGEEDGSTSFGCDLLIQMPLMDGSLDQLWEPYSFLADEHQALRVGIDICEALRSCHAAGVVHRDIKPENIFLPKKEDRRYLLGDFGISRITADSSKDSAPKLSVYYAAPEQFQGKSDERSDLYSLGLVLYVMTNGGLLPFAQSRTDESDISRAIRRRRKGEPLPPPSRACKSLAEVILKACAPDPGERWEDAFEFQSALEEVYAVEFKCVRLKNSGTDLLNSNSIPARPEPPCPPRKPDQYELLFEKYRAAAEQGDPEGQYMVGVAYFWGLAGQRQDTEAGAGWFLKAAQQGHRGAQEMIANCYQHGYGVERNDTLATVWRQASRKQDHPVESGEKPVMMLRSPCGPGLDKVILINIRPLGRLGDRDAQTYLKSKGLSLEDS